MTKKKLERLNRQIESLEGERHKTAGQIAIKQCEFNMGDIVVRASGSGWLPCRDYSYVVLAIEPAPHDPYSLEVYLRLRNLKKNGELGKYEFRSDPYDRFKKIGRYRKPIKMN